MRLLLVKERLFLFGELALSKSQYLYKKRRVFVLFFTVYNSFACTVFIRLTALGAY